MTHEPRALRGRSGFTMEQPRTQSIPDVYGSMPSYQCIPSTAPQSNLWTGRDFLYTHQRKEMEPERHLPPPWVEDFVSKIRRETCAELHAKVAFSVRIMLDQFKEEMKEFTLSVQSNDAFGIRRPEIRSCKKEGSMEPSGGHSVNISGQEPCYDCLQLAGERDRIRADLEEANRRLDRSEQLASELRVRPSQYEIKYYKELVKVLRADAIKQREMQQRMKNTLETVRSDLVRTQKELLESQSACKDLKTRMTLLHHSIPSPNDTPLDLLTKPKANPQHLQTRPDALAGKNRPLHKDQNPFRDLIAKENLEPRKLNVVPSVASSPIPITGPTSKQQDLKLEAGASSKDADCVSSSGSFDVLTCEKTAGESKQLKNSPKPRTCINRFYYDEDTDSEFENFSTECGRSDDYADVFDPESRYIRLKSRENQTQENYLFQYSDEESETE